MNELNELNVAESVRESRAVAIESAISGLRNAVERLENLLAHLEGGDNNKSAVGASAPVTHRPEFQLWGLLAVEIIEISERVNKSVEFLQEKMR